MKRKHAGLLALTAAGGGVLAVFIILIVRGIPADPVAAKRGFLTMGTTANVSVWADTEKEAAEIVDRIAACFRRIEEYASTYDPGSEISRLNAWTGAEPFAASRELANAIAKALDLAGEFDNRAGHSFDPTIGPLVELWKDAAEKGLPPSKTEIEASLGAVGYNKVAVKADFRIKLLAPGVSLDLGGIAKGTALYDSYWEFVDSGAIATMVEIGGEVCVAGVRPGDDEAWRVGIADPFETDKLCAVIEIRHEKRTQATYIATSGHYYRFTEIEGRKYSHIVDPETGYPVEENLASVTVLGYDGPTVDALATAIAVLGAVKGLQLAAQKGCEAYLIAGTPGNPKVAMTEGMKSYIVAE